MGLSYDFLATFKFSLLGKDNLWSLKEYPLTLLMATKAIQLYYSSGCPLNKNRIISFIPTHRGISNQESLVESYENKSIKSTWESKGHDEF